MNPNKALWEKGDFTQIAAFMREAGEGVARSLGVEPAFRVLDLGCGDGTTALPLAQLGAEVVGVDIAHNLVEAGRRRAREAGVSRLTLEEGDASELRGLADRSFDLTLSMFGAMFAPRPHEVARQMVRVTKPGGRIVMGNWIPNDPTSFVSELLKISAAYQPPPPEGFLSPMLWGVESQVIERFERAGIPPERITMEKDRFVFRSREYSADQFIERFRRFYGPTMNAFEAAEQSGKEEELLQKLLASARAHNRGGDGHTEISATYLRVSVRV